MDCSRTIVTNNRKVLDFYNAEPSVFRHRAQMIFCEKRAEVFERVRDLIHQNWALVNHPMAGNIPIHKHPYRSIMLRRGDALDFRSVQLWEAATERLNRGAMPAYPESVLEDFRVLDHALFVGSLKDV